MVLLCLLVLIWGTNCSEELIQVHVVSRHCDRTSVFDDIFPNCPVDLSKKLNLPPGSLTPLGECTYMEPGSSQIKDIPLFWNPVDFTFFSTQVERAIRSGWSITKGMFPVGHELDIFPLKGNFSLPGGAQSVPVKVQFEIINDKILIEDGICPIRTGLLQQWVVSPEGQKRIKELNEEYMDGLNKVAGTNYSYPQIVNLWDISVVLNDHQLLCPAFVDALPTMEDAIKVYLDMVWWSSNFSGGVPMGGGFAGEFTGLVDLLLEKGEGAKFIHYSAHDTSIMTIFSGFEIYLDYEVARTQPKFGASLYFELWKEIASTKHNVKVYYKSGWDDKRIPITLKSFGCDGFSCDYNLFKTLVAKKLDMSVEEWCKKCYNNFSEFCMEKPSYKINLL